MGMATAPTTAVTVLDSKMLVAVNAVDNNNKFWKYERLSASVTETNNKGKSETGDTRITWGRVGAAKPDQQLIMWDLKTIASKVADKLDLNSKEVFARMSSGQGLEGLQRKGKRDDYYTEVKVVSTEVTPVAAGQRVAKEQVKKLAVAEIAGGCPITASLVKRLAEANKHELVAATGGKMDIDLETGIVSTALGVVTLDAVKDARRLLDTMLPFVQQHDTDNRRYTTLLDDYLRLVPQSVGYKRGWHIDFIDITSQTSLLDQLETSVELAEQRMSDALKNGDAPKRPSLFECKLAVVEDSRVWETIKNAYYKSMNRGHSCSHLKPARVYEVTIPHMVSAFEADGKKVGNIKPLWHGTRIFNILSILKRGFVLPTQLSTAQTTGAMFGNGIYFSDQSTKSLNYSYGYWGGGGRDSNCFMFSVEVAMGREYIPSGPGNGKKSGYDSCFAKAGRSGVMNNEMIVYRTSQANIRYLVEFN